MKSSTKWYNISSPALKCEIAVKGTSQKRPSHAIWLGDIAYTIFPLTLFFLSFITLLFFDFPRVYMWLLFILLLVFSLWLLASNQLNTSSFIGGLSLNFNDFSCRVDESTLDLDAQVYCLSPSSRIGQFGCWLVLENKKKDTRIKRKIYVAKASLTAKDFSRLSRFIKMAEISNR